MTANSTTAAEANRKWCPFARLVEYLSDGGTPGTAGAAAINRDAGGNPLGMCIGADCIGVAPHGRRPRLLRARGEAMKTWLVILYLGKSVGIVGPLNVDLPSCFAMAEDREWLRPIMTAQSIPHALDDITLDCVRAIHRPALGEER